MNNLASSNLLMALTTNIPQTFSKSTVSTTRPSGDDFDTTTEIPLYYSMTNLYETLLMKYDTRVRPRKNVSHPIDVSGRFVLQGVFDLDTASQRLSILGYFIVSWKDKLLVWNTSLHRGIDEIKLPIGQIWVPPLRLALTHEGKGKVGDPDDVVIIQSDGYSWLASDNTYDILCDVDIKYYPFNKQNCEFYVYVATRGTAEVDINNNRFLRSTK